MTTVDYFIIAMAESELGHPEEARQSYQQALDAWPEDLKDPRAIRVIAPTGVLWFESAEWLNQLRDETHQRLATVSP